MARMFGTDGVRGLANVELTAELAFKLGRASGYLITKNKDKNQRPKVLVGSDSRISGDMLENAISAGMMSLGVDVYFAGVIPTPAMAYLVRKYEMDTGVMISASHNKMEDNGIKFFSKDGHKLSDEVENNIEDIIKNHLDELPHPVGEDLGRKYISENASKDYIDYVTSISENNIKGIKVAIDCANGATSYVAKEIFEKIGAEVLPINYNPTGTNINNNCGSTHLDVISEFVKNNNVDMGFAFDGDGDRCLAVDENGNEIDGDQILAILGKKLKKDGKLNQDTIVATVMSNLGLRVFGEENNLNIVSTGVGDRYVLEYMLKNDCKLGGEQSGHIIMLDYNTTGDGILTAVIMANIIYSENKKISELNKNMKKFPQCLVNVKVNNSLKHDYLQYDEIKKGIEELEKFFDGRGRVLIRPSGTEPILRIMIEGEDEKVLETEANKLGKIVEKYLS